MVAEQTLRRQALPEQQLQAVELQQAGRERTDVGPLAEYGRPAEAELCSACFALGLQGSPGSAPAAGPKPDRDGHEVVGR